MRMSEASNVSSAALARLVETATGEDAAIAAVQAGVARLVEVRTARAALARLDADTLRQLLAARRHRAGQDRP